ncbi:MAG: HAD-IC family P-type ATPase [Thermoleophilia bacterium]|nr:HAD-IC family P-type ATPase [Thermoleophilia bacterium]
MPRTAASGGERELPVWSLSPERALTALGGARSGLSQTEASVRLAQGGRNELEEARGPGLLRILLRQFASPLIYILLFAAVVALAFGELVDAAVIGAVLVLNATIGFSQELRARRSMAALRQLARNLARVVRGGREQQLDARDLVAGDIVLVEAGMKVPADCRVLHAVALEVDESLLTGESVTVGKRSEPVAPDAPVTDRAAMLFMGTIVVRGRGRAIVAATGARTELGSIAGAVRELGEVETPLQRRMARFARLIGVAVLASCAAGFAAGLATGQPLKDLVLAILALAVSAIPEGLPIVLTIALAISMRRMAQRRAIVRRLPAVETLGSCTVVGSDKTGTLTQNRMTVRAIVAGGERHDVTGSGLDPRGGFVPGPAEAGTPLALALLAGALCNDARAVPANGLLDVAGDPTEVALLVAAAKAGLFKDELEDRFERLAEIPFDSDRRYMATLNRGPDGAFQFVKGAPEEVLGMCDRLVTGGPLEPRLVLDEAERMAGAGMRVLASAYRPLGDGAMTVAGPPVDPEGLTLLGLYGLIDPPRDEAIAAVRSCQEAGIRVLMITGDHAATALAIARELGIAGTGERAVLGSELDGLDERQLDELVTDVSVFARVSPQHKLAIVESLKRLGHTVAVTGDGVNDAPALRAADIGVAMGESGTEVARDASDMVITDDNFASIAAAVEEGRVAFDNVRKTTFYQVSTGAAEIVAVLASLLASFQAPFVAAQIIWLNLVTNGIQDVALAFEPGERGTLRRPPRPRSEGVISALLWERTVLTGVVMAAGTLALFLHELHARDDVDRARTVALTTMVLFQAFHVGNSRSEHLSAFAKSPFSNRLLFAGTAAAVALHVGAMHFGPAQYVLRVEPLDVSTWLKMVGVSASVLVAVELHKLLRGPRPAAPRRAMSSLRRRSRCR